ncbi:STAS domain-containing protein [Streptomyces sp. NPDC059688]|uniref:STAS domain-containing protein n=1 Tax=Streptomyces albidocamelliae TaxID=2981135 RepID=A0ABY6EFC0_9ACTN|nr:MULTISPECIES: STAS domain-containing protein [unclassified Streptomyces]UXY33477.1 STAS domain-containing protein [Streptomyces sp. HUAS 14-6]
MPAAFETKVHVTRYEQVSLITMRGEVDHDDTDAVEAAFAEADQAAPCTTAVDLSQVTFVDSMLLNALLDAHRRHRADGRDLILLGPLQPAVHRLLSLSGTYGHFKIAGTGPTAAS